MMKTLPELGVEDFEAFPVWQFESGISEEEPLLRPVSDYPVSELGNRIVGTKVSLQNGDVRWAILGNIVLSSPRATMHVLTLSIESGGSWYYLARYHDVDYAERGPAGLARFLGVPVSDLFPIKYDLSSVALGAPGAVAGVIDASPPETLGQDELVALALE
jgi:hypothetical protein